MAVNRISIVRTSRVVRRTLARERGELAAWRHLPRVRLRSGATYVVYP